MAEEEIAKIRDEKLCVLQKPVWITELKASLRKYIGR
jgi:putative NADPH-quinone reductase